MSSVAPPPPPGWAPGPPPPPVGPPRIPDLPPRAVDYQQVLRGPRHREWRPLASLVVMVLSFVLVNIVGWAAALGVVAATGGDPERWLQDAGSITSEPGGFLVTNLTLAALVPCAAFAVWLGHGVPGRYLSSVTGRFRWRWFARCLLVLVPLWALYVGLGSALDPPPSGRPQQWVVLLLVMVLTTPLQCAGEEFAFRGWILQSLGSWARHRWVALVLPTVASCLLFGLAHGSKDPWVMADLSIFAVTACLMTWRTGGLEAAIALHCANNMLVMGISLVLGGFDEGFIDQGTTSSPAALVPSLVMMPIAYALVAWQARRAGIVSRTEPQIPPPPVVWLPATTPVTTAPAPTSPGVVPSRGDVPPQGTTPPPPSGPPAPPAGPGRTTGTGWD
ncbi:CPBP family intramembrane glutamic endopeptidase [Arsenicicoccus dermatophilus]|uniref:CPBP family intramembrane glutamic endopeptidase n=1 Tax=Arsenicicoccus dermatophilus TaxID=1076331 RepID=UPI001F4CA9A1|nr:type II CAAX endopeptidase family protein [Arsenicicoccus dermatophilus]MCH8613215.1 CPBP family intramembrane metalloprotease [Arsenicicoccus dermatophilus]